MQLVITSWAELAAIVAVIAGLGAFIGVVIKVANGRYTKQADFARLEERVSGLCDTVDRIELKLDHHIDQYATIIRQFGDDP